MIFNLLTKKKEYTILFFPYIKKNWKMFYLFSQVTRMLPLILSVCRIQVLHNPQLFLVLGPRHTVVFSPSLRTVLVPTFFFLSYYTAYFSSLSPIGYLLYSHGRTLVKKNVVKKMWRYPYKMELSMF